MGPVARYLGPEVPQEELLWQDHVPTGTTLSDADVATLKASILASGVNIADLVNTAWASASTFRDSDKRGGANGARIRLAPQNDWAVNKPDELRRVVGAYEGIQSNSGITVSMADLIVLGGCAAIEAAAKNAGHNITVPFTSGRGDASDAQTDADSFSVLEPTADGFRNYLGKGHTRSAEEMMVDRAQLLTLSAPEMTALVGGLRSMNGEFTDASDSLNNDFFVNLLDYSVEWSATDEAENAFEGRDRASGDVKWTGSRADLVFGSNSQLRAISEVYGSSDSGEKFVSDFVAAWDKVMNLDMF